MKVKLHKLGLGLAASMMLFAALPAHAINKYGCIYAVDARQEGQQPSVSGRNRGLDPLDAQRLEVGEQL